MALIRASTGRVDALVHNAGAMFASRHESPDGTEMTVATHVLAPFRLTRMLHPELQHAGRAVIVAVSSGGMYLERFDLSRLEMPRAGYRGAVAYARAKRAQVVLAHEWARRWGSEGIAAHTVRPGWVDTPGLAEGLPGLARLRPILRTPAEGADTIVWVVAKALHGSFPARGLLGTTATSGESTTFRAPAPLPGHRPRGRDRALALVRGSQRTVGTAPTADEKRGWGRVVSLLGRVSGAAPGRLDVGGEGCRRSF